MSEGEPLPLSCLNCGADLAQPGAVIVFQGLPGKSGAHFEQGVEDKDVVVVVDNSVSRIDITMQCFECGYILDDAFNWTDICESSRFTVNDDDGLPTGTDGGE